MFWPLSTHINTQKGRRFADISKCIFFNKNVSISIKRSLKFVPNCPINIISLYEPIMVCLLMHICATRLQWVNIMSALPGTGIPIKRKDSRDSVLALWWECVYIFMVRHLYTTPSSWIPHLHPEKSYQVHTVCYPKAKQAVKSLDTLPARFYFATIITQTGIISRFAHCHAFH